jgi:hypothetical protein
MRALAALLLMVGTAQSHSWYDPGCCSSTDCHAQLPSEFVTLTATGWQVDVPKFNIHELVAFNDKRVRDTPMDEVAAFHLCIFARALRCFYRRGAAG